MVKQIALVVFALSVLGGSCGCAYTHTQEGTSHFRVQVAGTGEEAALRSDLKFDGYTFEFRGDPLALGLRVVQDVKAFIGSLFPARTTGT